MSRMPFMLMTNFENPSYYLSFERREARSICFLVADEFKRSLKNCGHIEANTRIHAIMLNLVTLVIQSFSLPRIKSNVND